MSFGATVRGKLGELLQILVSRGRRRVIVQAASAGDLLQAGIDHAAPESMLEALMKITDLPKLVFDPA